MRLPDQAKQKPAQTDIRIVTIAIAVTYGLMPLLVVERGSVD
jgi:hypothetical protein